MRRRAVLAGLGTGLAAGVPTVAGYQDDNGPRPPNLTVGLEPIAEGFAVPTAVVETPNADHRYIADQTGQIAVHGPNGLRDESLLDLSDAIVDLRPGYDERGLLGLALHPKFAENRRLFVRYSAPPRPGTPEAFDHTFVLSEFTVSGDGTIADPDSERTILEIPEPQYNHNGGDLAFGPEGYLYVGVGDGGGEGDQGRGHVEDWYDAVPGGNGQDVTENLLGSILRIDIDGTTDDRRYAIPTDNPLVDEPGQDEHYAWGFRNPWRFSFDSETLLVADVGEHRYEEIDRVIAGGNYGWNVREGEHCFQAETCPTETPTGDPLREPVLEYPHSGGGVAGPAVVGGYVYRGETIPDLQGQYLFADWFAGGKLFLATPTKERPWPTTTVPTVPVSGPNHVVAFGRGQDDELFVCGTDSTEPSGSSGTIYRVVPPDQPPTETRETTPGAGGTITGFGIAAALLGGAGALVAGRRYR